MLAKILFSPSYYLSIYNFFICLFCTFALLLQLSSPCCPPVYSLVLFYSCIRISYSAKVTRIFFYSRVQSIYFSRRKNIVPLVQSVLFSLVSCPNSASRCSYPAIVRTKNGKIIHFQIPKGVLKMILFDLDKAKYVKTF